MTTTATPPLRSMSHAGDPDTSKEAAQRVRKVASGLHIDVMFAFIQLGPMTDEQLEQLSRFQPYGPSTIRKRRSELYHAGRLRDTGRRKANARGCKMVVWTIA